MRALHAPGLAIVLALATLFAPGHAQAEDASAYATQLATLRSEVASLHEAIEIEKEAQRGELRGIDAQKAELQAQIRREELRIRQLQEAVTERQTLIADDVEGTEVLVPLVASTIQSLRESVRSGLPYRATERLAALDKLDAQVADGSLRPQRAAALTWQFLEDELRLSRESAQDRQVVTVGGESQLVEVARVGMLALYFRTDEGRVGRAVKRNGDWAFEIYDDAASVERAEVVFDALTKQIRAGWFELPVEAM
ncbi:MAG: DUF3450 family protein [Proteobacteria bacterium]|nr:DUF3450 family protein [Pseudomonadota bacterium]